MKKAAAFWDSSALVPVCVQEASSGLAISYLSKFAPVVWWGSLVEIYGAICRLHRAGALLDSGTKGASLRLEMLSRRWKEIVPEDSLRQLAIDLLDRYSLRAADSLQLAAALVWCELRPNRRLFVCGDRRLSQAAGSAGFSVLALPG